MTLHYMPTAQPVVEQRSAYDFVPKIVLLLGEKPMTGGELGERLGIRPETAAAWANALVVGGAAHCAIRTNHRGPGPKPVEYWLAGALGGCRGR